METGTEVTTSYDPMLAKVVAHGSDRAEALDRLDTALAATRLDGIETNLGLVRAALQDADVRRAAHSTASLATISDPTPRIEIVTPGTLTTVQDWPGRTGHWQVGVPRADRWTTSPSGSATPRSATPRAHPASSAPSRARPSASPTRRRCASPAPPHR